MLLEGMAALTGAVLGTMLSPEVLIAAACVAHYARTWAKLVLGTLVGYLAVLGLRFWVLGVTADRIVTTFVAMILTCAAAYQVRRVLTSPIRDNTSR